MLQRDDIRLLGPEAVKIGEQLFALEEQYAKYENPHTEAPELMATIRRTVAAFEEAKRRYYDGLPESIKLLAAEEAALSRRHHKKWVELQTALNEHDASLKKNPL